MGQPDDLWQTIARAYLSRDLSLLENFQQWDVSESYRALLYAAKRLRIDPNELRGFIEQSIRGELDKPYEIPDGSPEEILGRFALVLENIDELKREAQALADQARSIGVTWKQIGDITHVTPESAYLRWSIRGRESSRTKQRKRRAAGQA